MRRHLHAHPELSFQEHNTSQFIKNKLDSWGVPYQNMADTGVVALVQGDLPSDHCVALRADMDALPINEVGGRPYGSKFPGIMHACGHDVHTASLLTVAHMLSILKASFAGRIKLIFQPGEELLPGGASLMIKEGVLENPIPEAVIGQHVMPQIPVGKVGFRSGKYMASTDELYFRVKGRGGHGAQPHMNVDPVVIASHIIIALQQVVSRKAHPIMPSVLSVGKVEAKGATNVIPDEVYMEGTFRTFDEQWRKDAHVSIRKIAQGIAESMGAVCEVDIRVGYPCLVNEEALTENAKCWAGEYLGPENVVDLDLWMAAEDFAYYTQKADACFYRLGTGNPDKNIVSAVHTPTFDIDEDALALSPGLMVYLALKQLGN